MATRSQFALNAVWLIAGTCYCAVAGIVSIRLLVCLAVVSLFQSVLGTLISRRLRPLGPAAEGVAYTVAWVVSSLAILVAALISKVLIAVLMALFVMALVWRSRPSEQLRLWQIHSAASVPWGYGATLAAAVGAIASLCWSFPALVAAAQGYSAFDAAVWVDAPFHASYLTAVARALNEDGYLDIHGAGLPTQLYHLGAYAIPALLKAATGAAALPMVQVLTAWGGITLAVAVYALASCFASRPTVAAGATSIVLLMPDFGLLTGGHPAFGFHWLLNVATASSFGLAIALVACAVMIQACRHRLLWGIALSWMLVLAVVAFKAQLFVLIAVPLFIYPALMWPGYRLRTRIAVATLMLSLVALATWSASFSHALPLVRFDFSSATPLLNAVATDAPAWQSMRLSNAAALGRVLSSLVVVLAFSFWLFTPWVVIWLFARFVPQAKPVVRPVAWPLLAFAGTFIVVAAGLAPDNRMATGGPLEVPLQGQVWGYACFAIAAALGVAERCASRWGDRERGMLAVGIIGAVALIGWCAIAQPVQRATRIQTPSLTMAPSPEEIATLRTSPLNCGLLFVADGDPLFVWQGALEQPSWLTLYSLNPTPREEVSQRGEAWKMPHSNVEQWLTERSVSLYVIPDKSVLPIGAVPKRSPDYVGQHFRAWRLSGLKPCR